MFLLSLLISRFEAFLDPWTVKQSAPDSVTLPMLCYFQTEDQIHFPPQSNHPALRTDEDLGPGLAVEEVDHDPPPVPGQTGAGVLD